MKFSVAAMAVLSLASGLSFADGSPIYDHAKNQNNAYASKLSKLKWEVTSLQKKVNSTRASGSLKADKASGAYVSFDRSVSSRLNGDDQLYGKQKTALDGIHGVVLGGYIKAAAEYYREAASGEATKDGSEMWLPNADVSVAAQVTKGLVGFVQFGHEKYYSTDTAAFGLKDMFLAYKLGDNMYVAAGKGDVAFGDMTRVNVYENPYARNFVLNGNYAMFGMSSNGLDATISLLNGGKNGDKVKAFKANTPANQINNFALNVKYTLPTMNSVKVSVGAGYENAGQYTNLGDDNKLSQKDNTRNPVYDLNAELSMDQLRFVAEYITTVDRVNKNSSTDTNKAATLGLGASYSLSQFLGNQPATLALSYGQGKTGLAGDTWERQYIASVDQQIMKGVNLGLEYAHYKDTSSKTNSITAVLTSSF